MNTSIIILSMNQLAYTRRCVESIAKHTPEPHELIFVDNGSTDGTPDWLKTVPGATVIANETNRGFAAACNQGMRVAKGGALLLLNNDVIVTEGWLGGLLRCLQSAPEVGLTGPMTNYISGIQKVENAKYPDMDSSLQDYARRFARENAGRYLPTKRLVGFALLFKREVMERIGMLDEDYGGCGSFEDDDYCLRARKAGYTLLACGDVFIHHFGHVTLDDPGNELDKNAQSRINKDVFLSKWKDTVENDGLKVFAPAEQGD